MLTLRFVACVFPVATMVLGAGVVSGQDYPSKPIRIVTSEPGGSGDFAGRLIAQGLTGLVGQQVIVENRGGSVAIPAEIVARASPDGHTLLLYGGTFWVGPLLETIRYDVERDFAPVILAAASPGLLVVHPSVAATSVKELIALAKARPGVLNYSSGATGAITHLAAELFKVMARVDIVRIPYKGAGPAINGLIGGQAHLMFSTAVSLAPHVKSGRLRALAVTTAQPSALVPGLPTVAASGLPGYEAVSNLGVFVPAKTSATIITRLNRETVRVLNRAEVKEKFMNTGTEIVGSLPEQFAAIIKSDTAKWRKVIRDTGIRAD